MSKRSMALHKGLSEILEGAYLPEEARGSGSKGSSARKPDDRPALDPIALFEDIARKQRLMRLPAGDEEFRQFLMMHTDRTSGP